jgi:hypothetical protein
MLHPKQTSYLAIGCSAEAETMRTLFKVWLRHSKCRLPGHRPDHEAFTAWPEASCNHSKIATQISAVGDTLLVI